MADFSDDEVRGISPEDLEDVEIVFSLFRLLGERFGLSLDTKKMPAIASVAGYLRECDRMNKENPVGSEDLLEAIEGYYEYVLREKRNYVCDLVPSLN